MTEPSGLHADLTGRRVLVTGSSQGIGLAIAKALVNSGAKVCINAPSQGAELDLACREAGAAIGIGADLTRPDEVERLVTAATDTFGGVDILVLNAALQERQPWAGFDRASIDRQWEINLAANYRLIQAFVPAMAERGFGRLIAIGSIQQVREHPEMLVYAASKAALESMVRNIARQVAGQGVTCNLLAPGAIATARKREALTPCSHASRLDASGRRRIAPRSRCSWPPTPPAMSPARRSLSMAACISREKSER